MAPRWLSLLLVLVAAVLAHARGLWGGFVYDDHRFIEQNAALSPLRPLDYFADPGTASAATGEGVSADIYRPLRTLLFGLEHAVFGKDPTGWHALSLLLHALNAWLVLRLLRGLLGDGPGPVVAAVLFAVHPVTVESVGWISSQGDLLALTLMLATLDVLRLGGATRTAAGVVLAALACLAKESAVVLPALLLLRDRALPVERALPWRVTLLRTGLLTAVVAGYFVLRLLVLPGLAQVPHPDGGVLASARGFLAASTWYAGALVWPSGFRFETDLLVPLSWGDPAVVVGLGLWVTLLAAGVLAWRRGRPAVTLFATWGALAALIPVSQVLVPLKTLAAERFLYPVLPCAAAGLAAALAWLAQRRGPIWAWAPLVLAVPLGWVTTVRTRAWEDDETLWRAVRRDRPANARAYEGLGFALLKKGRYGDAERAYTSYFRASPFDGKAHYVFAGHLESLALTLGTTSPEVAATSDIGQRRRELLALTIAELGRAVSVWDEVGLEAGRGSKTMLQDALRRMLQASLELGDLAQARRANHRLLALAGFDPEDTPRVLAEAPFPLRRTRWYLAWRAVSIPERPTAAGARDERLRQRADAVRDMGLNADLDDRALARELEAPFLRLIAEAEAALARAPAGIERERAFRSLYNLWRIHEELLRVTGRTAEAKARFDEAERRRVAEQSGRAS